MFLLIPLKFGKSQFLANLVIANAQLLNLFVYHVHLPTGFKVHTVDDTVRMDVLSVNVCTHQNFTAVEVSSKSVRCFVRCARINVRTFREALHHVVKHHAAVFMVQQLRTQKFVERSFRLTANTADELLSIPERLIFLCHIAHHAFHAAVRLCALFVVHEMDDCDFPRPPSCSSRRVTLIFANSCAAVSRLANCTLPMFASTAS